MEPPRFHLTRNTIALSIKAIAILSAITAIYFQDLALVANEALRSELMSHTLPYILLLIYLLYRKRKMLRAVTPLENRCPSE